jgi:hypothetical protein
MAVVKLLSILLIAGLPAFAGCGGDEGPAAPAAQQSSDEATQPKDPEPAAPEDTGTKVTLGDSSGKRRA